MKNYLHITLLTVIAFAIHKFILLPQLNIQDTVPVVFQHLLLGGVTVFIYAITDAMVKRLFSSAGFVVVVFLMLKMIVVVLFANRYKLEMDEQPSIKFILFGIYFFYMIITLLKIIPLLNVELPENEKKTPEN